MLLLHCLLLVLLQSDRKFNLSVNSFIQSSISIFKPKTRPQLKNHPLDKWGQDKMTQTAPKMSSLFGLKLKLILTKIKIQQHKHTSAASFKAGFKLENLLLIMWTGSLNCSTSVCRRENTIILKKIPTLKWYVWIKTHVTHNYLVTVCYCLFLFVFTAVLW